MHGSTRPSYAWNVQYIPTEMMEEPRWLNWRTDLRDGKWTKVPYQPGTNRKASSTDPETWGTFWEAADSSYSGEGTGGIGFVLGDGWLGVDLDDVRDDDAPNGMEPWVWEWLLTHDAYAEWSVSGTGIHVLTKGASLPPWSVNRRGQVEVYQAGRYFTVTGRAVFADRRVPCIQGALEALCRARLQKEAPNPPEPTEAPTAPVGGLLDESAADWALACTMAQRGLPGPVIESALRTKMREEGRSEKAARHDYIPNTVAKALERSGGRRQAKAIAERPPVVLEPKPFQKTEFPVEMREEIVGGLVRRGEVVNWIGAPTTGKSWLLHRLIMGMVTGNGFTCKRQDDLWLKQGRCLLVDVELHAETLENRLWQVAQQVRATADECRANLDLLLMRGEWGTLDDVEDMVGRHPPRHWQCIALDAFYRFIPAGMRENENADMTQLYNQLDRIAKKADAAIVVVHHTTKGVQTEKSTMDVGAGAGAIGRATDTHVTFLRHRSPNCIVMNSETRSFKRPEAKVLHCEWPDIAFDSTKDASQLWTPNCGKGDDE